MMAIIVLFFLTTVPAVPFLPKDMKVLAAFRTALGIILQHWH